jgi:hypothetical protein
VKLPMLKRSFAGPNTDRQEGKCAHQPQEAQSANSPQTLQRFGNAEWRRNPDEQQVQPGPTKESRAVSRGCGTKSDANHTIQLIAVAAKWIAGVDAPSSSSSAGTSASERRAIGHSSAFSTRLVVVAPPRGEADASTEGILTVVRWL